MNFFLRDILQYFKTGFNLKAHLGVALFLAVSIYFNYTYDIYNTATDNYYHQFKGVLWLFAFFSMAFLVAIVILQFSRDKTKTTPFFSVKKAILFGLTGIFFLAMDCSYYLMQFTKGLFSENPYVARWMHACVSNLSSFLIIIVPLFILYMAVSYFKPERYGLRFKGAHVLPYFGLILLMLPLIYIASLQSDFLAPYPVYTNHYEYLFLPVDQWVTVGIYELSYGFDFLSIELFFRGFMVIALSKFVDKEAILVMVTVYCFLHFGKPMGEAISSIFGGYILGILAYTSRNIYGGLVAHLGVAWGMEYMAFLQLH